MYRILPIILFYLGIFQLVPFSNAWPQPGVGEKLPVFQLSDVTGKPVSLESYSGKIVLVHLWKCK